MDDKINKAHDEIKKVLKEHDLRIDQVISFPVYRKLPDEVQLALKVITKHGMKIQLILEPIKKK